MDSKILGDYVEILSGYAFNSKLFNEDGVGKPIIRIRDVGKKDSNTFYSGEYDDKYLINKGDYLIGMDGEFRIAEWEGKESLLNQRVCKIWSKNVEMLNDGYLIRMLPKELKQIEDTTSFATVKHLSVKKINNIKISLPPLETQKKIAAILDEADKLRQLDKQLIEKYDALTQSLFLDMFGDPVTNPKGWDLVDFKDVLVLKRGFDLPVQDRTRGDFPIMAANGILDWHNEFKVKGPGVVTGRSGTLGKVHFIENNYWPLNTALYSQDLKRNNPLYILFLLRNFRVERFSRGAGVPTLNRNLVHSEKIISVPIELQNQFAERVEAIEAQKALAQKSLEKSEELFNSLLQKAFKGELV